MEIVDREVRLSEIDETVGPRPAERLIESVRRNGVVVPVILAERVDDNGELHLIIVDGNRRVAAARTAGLDSVPGRILQQASDPEMANLTLLTNNFRTSNYVTEFWAMNELQRAGVERQHLGEFTGMTASTIATRELLAQLDRRIFIGLSEGTIGPSIALAVARLEPGIQRELGDLFVRKGRLTKAQVDAVSSSRPAHPADLPEIDTEGRVLPDDLKYALIAVARQVTSRGIDEETWLQAAARAFREAQQ